jgi:hypothetical protein
MSSTSMRLKQRQNYSAPYPVRWMTIQWRILKTLHDTRSTLLHNQRSRLGRLGGMRQAGSSRNRWGEKSPLRSEVVFFEKT